MHLDSEEPSYEPITNQCIMTSVVMGQISMIFFILRKQQGFHDNLQKL